MDVTPRTTTEAQPDDPAGLDLTPRTGPTGSSGTPGKPKATGPRRYLPLLAIAVLVLAGGYILTQALGSATTYFYRADEAVAKKDSLGTSRFRLEGDVVDTPSDAGPDAIAFTVEANGTKVRILHTGSEPPLFDKNKNIPVVCEGHWNEAGTAFLSDRIIVKHTETYKAANPDRVDPSAP